MILGISSSGRKNGITSKTVKEILKSSELEYEYISLSGLNIKGCIGCLECASDNICKIKDDWHMIREKMINADAIVFGAPNYYGTINAIGHACLERTFSFRHREIFSLESKIGVTVSSSHSGEMNAVNKYINKVMSSNRMIVIEDFATRGYAQCYTCGYGHDCNVGNVVKDHGILEKIEKEHYPKYFKERKYVIKEASRIGRVLSNTLRKKVNERKK
ncbi:MAG TPA: flavodoxin family protein [Clostridia bacterium]|nr:flavodoxin family protein [Clostridia bacterium]